MADEQLNVAAEEQQVPFAIQRIYVKDISFESPNAPAIFRKEWQPEVKLDLDTRSEKLEDNMFEVILSLTVTTTVGGETAFLCEVQQAGIFAVPELQDAQMAHMLASFCPNILFPYVREVISDATSRAGFPPVMLNPMNFEVLYQQQQAQKQQQAGAPVTH